MASKKIINCQRKKNYQWNFSVNSLVSSRTQVKLKFQFEFDLFKRLESKQVRLKNPL